MKFESGWEVYRTRFLVCARQLNEPLKFTDALGREQSGHPGDYLVEYSDGVRRIITRTLFEDIYVPLSAEPRIENTDSQTQRRIAGQLPQAALENRSRASA